MPFPRSAPCVSWVCLGLRRGGVPFRSSGKPPAKPAAASRFTAKRPNRPSRRYAGTPFSPLLLLGPADHEGDRVACSFRSRRHAAGIVAREAARSLSGLPPRLVAPDRSGVGPSLGEREGALSDSGWAAEGRLSRSSCLGAGVCVCMCVSLCMCVCGRDNAAGSLGATPAELP